MGAGLVQPAAPSQRSSPSCHPPSRCLRENREEIKEIEDGERREERRMLEGGSTIRRRGGGRVGGEKERGVMEIKF